MPKLPLAITAVTSALVTLATGSVAQPATPELPMAIMCWLNKPKTWRVGYLHTVNENGAATYFTVDGRLSVTLNTKGVLEPPSNRPATADCFGKTLEQLRATGRVIEFQRQPAQRPRRSGRADLLWAQNVRSVSAHRRLRRQNSARHQASRHPCRAADQIRDDHQLDHCEGAGTPTIDAARPRRRGDRVSAPGKAGAIQPVEVRP